MEAPAIKGAAIQGTWERLTSLVATGRVTREAFDLALEDQPLADLDGKIEPGLWYPIGFAARLAELVVQAEGGPPGELMREIGRATARRFAGQGAYKAFIESALRQGPERAGRSLIRISELVFNFGRWRLEGDSLAAFSVRIDDADALPETTRFSLAGFIEELAGYAVGSPVEVTTSRESPSRVRFDGRPAGPK